jgi:dihydroneopterin aldolase
MPSSIPEAMTRPPKLEGWLEIRALRCDGRHGAYEGEHERTVTFLVDIDVRTDVGPAVANDRLEATMDLASLAATAREIVGGPSRMLLERVSADVARAILERFPGAREVRVRVAKPEPPGLGAAAEAATISLTRARLRAGAATTRGATRGRRAGRRERG